MVRLRWWRRFKQTDWISGSIFCFTCCFSLLCHNFVKRIPGINVIIQIINTSHHDPHAARVSGSESFRIWMFQFERRRKSPWFRWHCLRRTCVWGTETVWASFYRYIYTFSRINRSRHHWQQTIALCARSPVGCVHRIVNPISDWLVKMKWRNKTLRIKQSRNLNYSVARYSIGCAPVFRSRMPAQTGEWFGSGALSRSVDWLLNLSRLQSIECVCAVSFRSFRLSLGLLPENATTFDLKSKALNDPNARFEIELN